MSNYQFKTTNIRGKQYVEVNERIKFFRQEDQYKNWSVITDFTLLDDAQCVCKASIVDSNNRIISTGHAHEVQGSSNINKTSYVENCETSAIGRALAMLGIGIDTSIASANEVADAIAKQDSKEKPPAKPDFKHEASAEAVVEANIMDKAVAYIKSQTDKKKAFEAITAKYGEQLSEKQVAGLGKFVR
jgi:hypothetical protein|tara:strand:- start:1111 stop:1674 length:564 start_codon:yes stop_codon:yes gene_type:complete